MGRPALAGRAGMRRRLRGLAVGRAGRLLGRRDGLRRRGRAGGAAVLQRCPRHPTSGPSSRPPARRPPRAARAGSCPPCRSTNLVTFQEPYALAPFLAVRAAVEPSFMDVHVLAAPLAMRAGLDGWCRRGSVRAVIRCGYPPAEPGNAPTRPRSQSTVCATPSRTPIRARQPSSRSAFSTLGQRRTTSTVEARLVLEREGVGVAAAGLPDDARDLGHGQLLAGADVEVLVAGRRASPSR